MARRMCALAEGARAEGARAPRATSPATRTPPSLPRLTQDQQALLTNPRAPPSAHALEWRYERGRQAGHMRALAEGARRSNATARAVERRAWFIVRSGTRSSG